MPIANTYGKGFSGGSTLAAIQRLAALQDLDEEKKRLAGAAERQLISASLGAVPILGGALSGFEQSAQAFQQADVFGAGRSFDEPRQNPNQGFAATGSGGGVGGGVSGTGAALGDLSTIAAQEELDRARRRAESTSRLASIVGAVGGVGSAVQSLIPILGGLGGGGASLATQPGTGAAASTTVGIAPTTSPGIGPDSGGIGTGFTASSPATFAPTSTGRDIGIDLQQPSLPDIPSYRAQAMDEILSRRERPTLGSILRQYFLRRR